MGWLEDKASKDGVGAAFDKPKKKKAPAKKVTK